jgi:hypothetical protein
LKKPKVATLRIKEIIEITIKKERNIKIDMAKLSVRLGLFR